MTVDRSWLPLSTWAIVVPINARNGEAHEAFRAELANVFGGFSAYVGTGAWRDAKRDIIVTEAHVRYEVSWSGDEEPALAFIAETHFPEEAEWYVAHVGYADCRTARGA